MRVTAAPIVPLDLLCASGTSYFGVPPDAVRPGRAGRRHRRRAARCGSRRRPGWRPATAAWPRRPRSRRPTWCRCPRARRRPRWPRSGCPPSRRYMALTWRGELAAGRDRLVLGAGGVVGQAAAPARPAVRRRAGGGRGPVARRAAARAGRRRGRGGRARHRRRRRAGRAAGCGGDGPVDLVLDPLYGVPAAAAAKCLRPGGRLVNLGGSAAEHAPLDSSTIRSRSLRVLGYTNNALTREQKAAAMTAVAQHAAAGELSGRARGGPARGRARRVAAPGLRSGRRRTAGARPVACHRLISRDGSPTTDRVRAISATVRSADRFKRLRPGQQLVRVTELTKVDRIGVRAAISASGGPCRAASRPCRSSRWRRRLPSC